MLTHAEIVVATCSWRSLSTIVRKCDFDHDRGNCHDDAGTWMMRLLYRQIWAHTMRYPFNPPKTRFFLHIYDAGSIGLLDLG